MASDSAPILAWAESEAERRAAAQFFARVVRADPAYISHGEIQWALSPDGVHWAPDLEARLEREFVGDCTLLRYGANNLVALGEAKLRCESVDVDDVARAAAGLVLQNHGERLDTVILACTHFPLLEDELRQAFGEGVAFIHGAEGIARRIVSLTEGQDFAPSVPDFAVGTGELADFQRLAPAFARYRIDDLRAF